MDPPLRFVGHEAQSLRGQGDEAAPIAVGESAFITGETTGVLEFEPDDIRVAFESVDEAPQGVYCSIKVPAVVRRGDKLYKTVPVDPARCD